MANKTSNRKTPGAVTRIKCEICEQEAKFVRSYLRKDLRVREYQCAEKHRNKVFVAGLPKKHDPETHLYTIKEIIAGRFKP